MCISTVTSNIANVQKNTLDPVVPEIYFLNSKVTINYNYGIK